MKNVVKIIKIEDVARDVKLFAVEKPVGYKFIPGQATEVSINKPKWRHEERPFTFTNLTDDEYLEFIIKQYPEHKGVTQELHKLSVGDELIIRNVFGTINYKGKGVFIAGGAGITPFIAIFRQLKKDNKIIGNRLFFSNKTKSDIIIESELREIFKETSGDLILTLTEQEEPGYNYGLIDEKFLKNYINNFNQKFYLCGPPKMVEQLTILLKKLGADINSVIFEGK